MAVPATFADLPIELSEYIILLSARALVRHDRGSLASLARTCRAIHALAQPILVECVVFTSENAASILGACALPDAFRGTRKLLFEDLDGTALSALQGAVPTFAHVEACAGPARCCYIVLLCAQPSILVVTSAVKLPALLAAPRAARLANVTHLRTHVAPLHALLDEPDNVPLRLTHVALAVERGNEWPASRVIVRLAPWILALPTLERLLIALPDRAAGVKHGLRAFASQLQERRLWVDVGPDPKYEPSAVFDLTSWLAGEPLYSDA